MTCFFFCSLQVCSYGYMSQWHVTDFLKIVFHYVTIGLLPEESVISILLFVWMLIIVTKASTARLV